MDSVDPIFNSIPQSNEKMVKPTQSQIQGMVRSCPKINSTCQENELKTDLKPCEPKHFFLPDHESARATLGFGAIPFAKDIYMLVFVRFNATLVLFSKVSSFKGFFLQRTDTATLGQLQL